MFSAFLGASLALIPQSMEAAESDCSAAPAGAVGWWSGEGNANDLTGRFNGTAHNVSFTAGKVGQGFNFNGVNSYVSIADAPQLSFTNELTVEFWFLSRSWSGGGGGLFSKRDAGNLSNYGLNVSDSYGFDVYYEDPTVSGGDYSPGISGFEISAFFPLPTTGVFHHTAMTFKQVDSDHVRVDTYLDGTLATNKTMLGNLSRTINQAPLVIGATGVGSGQVQYFNGIIDEFTLYGRALSASEIQGIFNAGDSGKCAPPVAPTISQQPSSQTVGVGSDVTFAVSATGTAPLSFQWLVNDSLIPDATNSSLTLSNVQTFDSGSYSVRVTNIAGQITSTTATLIVQVPACVEVPAGLIGWWPGDGNAADYYGQLNGVGFNVSYAPGRVGQAFNFNGMNSYIAISNSPELNITNELTIELWFLSRNWLQTGMGLFSKRDSIVANYGLNISQTYGLDVYYEDPKVSGGDYSPGTSGVEISAYFPLPSANQFHHAACTMKQVDGGHVTVGTYIDGTLVTNKTMVGNLTNTLNQAALIIGATGVGNGILEYFNGLIDEFTLYNRALSAEEINGLFTADSWGKCKDPVAPAITQQPQSQTAIAGSTISIAVKTKGTYPAFQWRFNGSPVSEGTNATLTLNNVSLADAGSYDVIVSNSSGSVTSDVALVQVKLPRRLEIADAPAQQEGTSIQIPITLVSEGDVGGITFAVNFDTTYLRNPDLAWDSILDGSFNNVNTNTAGQLRATFALPATTIPAGTQTLAQLSFFLRSVPHTLTTPLTLQILDMSGASGETLTGTVARSSSVIDKVRKITGDNNANDRLDVGDATVVLRYLAALDPVRSWDVPLNDINQNAGLDSGDTIRILRAASGIDPQPPVPPAAFAFFTTQSLTAEAPANATLVPGQIRTGPASNATVQVLLQNTGKPIAGAAVRLHYDTNALRLTSSQSYHTGSLVPANALSVWNIAPSQNVLATQNGDISLATSTATSWPATDGVLAELTFQVQPGATNQYLWPITLVSVETTEDGYVNHQWSTAGATVSARGALPARLNAGSGLINGHFSLSLSGDAGASYIVETSEDLVHWTFLETIANSNGTTTVTDANAGNVDHRFYRSRPATSP